MWFSSLIVVLDLFAALRVLANIAFDNSTRCWNKSSFHDRQNYSIQLISRHSRGVQGDRANSHRDTESDVKTLEISYLCSVPL